MTNNRYAFGFVIAFFVSAVSNADSDAEEARTQENRAKAMNLLVIQTDEHNFRTLGCYRETLTPDQARIWGPEAIVETPAIDSLAHRGAICTSFYATSPVCTPSRAAFFSGRYPHNTGAPQNDLPLDSDVVTFAEVLQRVGYATGYAGKWHLDGPGKPQWEPSRHFGFKDNRYLFNRGHWKKFELTASGPRVAAVGRNGQPSYALDDADETTFSTDWLADRAMDFIREHAEEPFCYHLSLPDPHGPNTVRPPYDTMYQNLPIRPPLTFSMSKQNPAWAGPESKNASLKFNASQMALYFGMVKCIDDNVAQILATLNELDLTDRTIIVFTSDHGDLCYEHGRLNKGNPYEGSAKIPMIICAPGIIQPGTRIDQALGTVDFAPTILSLMNQSAPSQTEGRDASVLFAQVQPDSVSRPRPWNDIAFLRASQSKPTWVAAVTDRFKLVVAANEEPYLFDLESDPDELGNQIQRTEHATIVRTLANQLLHYGETTGDPQLQKGVLKDQLTKLAN
ncbi:sulfatase family protein [Neorhodopirellula pilleata]|uniref:Choline-sulfatase n=1 Tax=Neorhodopirellula pilleata TaxID=2714738 RepID=A0A5C5ZL32_9BACT|nr:sulfatase [Neorhodopirellula pilleata]TWT87898.1 Choline-sulfatase [Neorhodopirellula pilleata]